MHPYPAALIGVVFAAALVVIWDRTLVAWRWLPIVTRQ